MAMSEKLNKTLRNFIERQHVFFVATAGRDGRVNVSPKGLNTLRIVDDQAISWLNLSGSGNETAVHVLETGRMTLMFCSFEGAAMILRVYGKATVLHPKDNDWESELTNYPALAGSRQIFKLAIDLVQTSCGSGVPEMTFSHSRGEKDLVPFYEKMGTEGVREYWARKNTISIDGKPTGIFD